ncbi:MFS transporter [Halobacillus aidingensis]|uniref:Predicted arabinose efflux permease, MFS family n=1 Tax=Halobacillus aidingensis TaxID=240303 RepID=A0A1H0VBM4_HALAD|nr:MFS transporter [Halobacillus aidingensis]SDP75959.1 Predicted arabinose efflux permease, MFS family [Halobacillus aidingensis]
MDRANTRKLMSGYFLYESGRAMYFVLITWFLYQWTDDALYTGLFVSFGFIPGLFSNVIFGVLVDRSNRKKLAVLAGVISTICLVLLTGAFWGGVEHPWLMITAHMIMQTAGSLFRPSLQALVAEVFPKDSLPRIFSWSGSSTVAGSLTGAAVGGVLAGLAAVETSLSVVILLYLGATVTTQMIRYTPVEWKNRSDSSSFWDEMKEGFVYVHQNRILYGLFIMLMLGQLTFHTTLGFLSVYTSSHLKQSALVYGMLDSTFSIGGIIAGLIGTWWWAKCQNRIGIWSLLLTAAGLAIVSFTTLVPMAFLGFLFIGMGTSFVRALLQSVQQMATDSRFHGRMSSLRMLCNQTSVVVAGPIFGVLASSHGAPAVFLCLLISVTGGVFWAHIQSKHPIFKQITKPA